MNQQNNSLDVKFLAKLQVLKFLQRKNENKIRYMIDFLEDEIEREALTVFYSKGEYHRKYRYISC